jgi:hypothetical protein
MMAIPRTKSRGSLKVSAKKSGSLNSSRHKFPFLKFASNSNEIWFNEDYYVVHTYYSGFSTLFLGIVIIIDFYF